MTELCRDDDRGGKKVDGLTEGELLPEIKQHFHQQDDGFAPVRSRGTPHGDLAGVSRMTSPPPRVPKWSNGEIAA